MKLKKTAAWAFIALASCMLGLTPSSPASNAMAPVRIGMAQTMFVDIPQPLVDLLTHPFGAMMKQFTGMEGKLQIGGDALELARKLDDKNLDLAVFQGVEFAWAKSKFANLEPLMVAIYHQKKLTAHLVVGKDCQINAFADLKGKILAVPMRSKEHCRLFLEQHCADCGQANPKAFFEKICTPGNPESALDDVLAGTCQATIVDKVSLDYYEYLKPGAYKSLKVIKTSEAFPPAVLAYRKGVLDDATLERFKQGMLKASKNERGRDMMGMWRISSFEPVPEDFTQHLADILKVYPAPETPAKVSRVN